ncbi:hypothetical protein BDK51DRAFT_41821 [Blyttiomyces helicus]|uniref:F-box domain-containing protein n=1 Tax=Blyttiomyces helicus TaxID=388810 RepID=A0A4V1IR12_9FUNG|nr:hypothetical protein BDK51DRAFT_41821 [Blyttiomyces helicus]|eukprot:RKO88447.1 hypothetical protein BDK51DRAFT_41821 [Blyttiomyces helicus]
MIKGVRRPRSLQFSFTPTYKASVALETATNRATGTNLISWMGTASAAEHVSVNCPNLKYLDGSNLEAPPVAVLAVACDQLASIELSGSQKWVTDDGVRTLLHNPGITELRHFDTEITLTTLHVLKTHRPLTLLTLGGPNHKPPAPLLSARGASLTRLCIGEPGWRMGADLATMFPNAVASPRSLHLHGKTSVRVLASLSHRLPVLRDLGVDNSVNRNELQDSVPTSVSLYEPSDFNWLGMGDLWARIAGATPP